MRKRPARRGFTLREMFAVIAIICLLLAVLVPWIQSSREAARRTECDNNLHQVAIALSCYHDMQKMFPMGVMHSGSNPGGESPIQGELGPSWWFGARPYFCDSKIYREVNATQEPGTHDMPQFRANDMLAAGVRLNDCVRSYMRCPASGIPMMETATGPIQLPSYVGIAGGCDIDPDAQDYTAGGGLLPGLAVPTTDKRYQNKAKGSGAATGGIVTSSGLLPPCEHVGLADCTDGAANTMIVAEQSDWLFDQNPASSKKYHGDPGWTVGGTGPGGGWLSGTSRVDPVPQVDMPGGPPAPWGADCWNITTVRYPPNCKRVMGATPLPGCSENHGINSPLQSAHPGGLLVGMADGSVRFVSGTTDLGVLLRMAIRDDGQEVSGD